MAGVVAAELDSFTKLRSYQKEPKDVLGAPAPKPKPKAKSRTNKPSPGSHMSCGTIHSCMKLFLIFCIYMFLRKEMPADDIPAMEWLVPQLLKDLSQAKILPIRLSTVKHQETLRPSSAHARPLPTGHVASQNDQIVFHIFSIAMPRQQCANFGWRAGGCLL